MAIITRNGKWLWNDLIDDLESHGLPDVELVACEPLPGPHGSPYIYLTWGRFDFLVQAEVKSPGEMRREDFHELRYCVVTMREYKPSIVETFHEMFEEPPLGLYEKQHPSDPSVWVSIAEWEFVNPHHRAAQLGNERDNGVIRKIRTFIPGQFTIE